MKTSLKNLEVFKSRDLDTGNLVPQIADELEKVFLANPETPHSKEDLGERIAEIKKRITGARKLEIVSNSYLASILSKIRFNLETDRKKTLTCVRNHKGFAAYRIATPQEGTEISVKSKRRWLTGTITVARKQKLEDKRFLSDAMQKFLPEFNAFLGHGEDMKVKLLECLQPEKENNQ